MLAGFRSRWTIPRSCAYSSASAICPRERQRLVERQRTARDVLGKGRPFDEFHHERRRSSTP